MDRADLEKSARGSVAQFEPRSLRDIKGSAAWRRPGHGYAKFTMLE